MSLLWLARRVLFTFVSSPLRSTVAAIALLMALLPHGVHAKDAWKPIAAEELAETKPVIEPEAPAEVLERTVTVNDHGFPDERVTTEYIRYKIYDAQKVDEITRVSHIVDNYGFERTEINARLTLPGGKSQEFGRESIKERPYSKQGQQAGFFGWLAGSEVTLKEKFMAIPGVEAGAILEYQIRNVERYPSRVEPFTAQREGLPVRKYAITFRLDFDSETWSHQVFVFNRLNAEMTETDKPRTISIKAANLPSVTQEPLVGPATDYAMTILSCYTVRDVALTPWSGKVRVPGTVDGKLGPWAFQATLVNWNERDRGYPVPRLKQLATELTMGAKDDLDKARRIHEHVRTLVQHWRKRKVVKTEQRIRYAESVVDVLDWEGQPEVRLIPPDFYWLAIGLYQAAGLDAHTILLPDRKLCRFYRENVSPVFLPNLAAAIRIGGVWRFSSPHHDYALPFGMLPWDQEGQQGLLAHDRKEDFIPVPAAAPKESVTASLGAFTLDEEGTLSGTVRRTLTGHAAAFLRRDLLAVTAEKRDDLARARLGFDLKTVEVTLDRIASLEETERPLEIIGRVRWPGYAVLTKDRMIVRPAAFRAEATSPFSAESRKLPVHFPYRWQELDRVSIKLPDGYAPESPAAPSPMPGELLSCRTQIAYEKEKNTLHLLRDFSSNLMEVSKADYAGLRNWYATLVRANQHEVIFTRKAAARTQTEKSEQ